MKYRKMAEHITEQEIKLLLDLVYEGVEYRGHTRYIKSNFIEVYYAQERKQRLEQVDFLPDDIYVYKENTVLDGEPIKNGNILYSYQQYMIAKGYSEYWENNPYL